MKSSTKKVFHNKRCDECGKLIGHDIAFLVKPSFTANKEWCLCKSCKYKLIKGGKGV